MTATYSKPLALTQNCHDRMQGKVMHTDNYVDIQVTHPEYDIDQHDIESINTDHMLDASVIGSSVDDPKYDSKIEGNGNLDIISHDCAHKTGIDDSSVSLLVSRSFTQIATWNVKASTM